jgi:hypothetical protein
VCIQRWRRSHGLRWSRSCDARRAGRPAVRSGSPIRNPAGSSRLVSHRSTAHTWVSGSRANPQGQPAELAGSSLGPLAATRTGHARGSFRKWRPSVSRGGEERGFRLGAGGVISRFGSLALTRPAFAPPVTPDGTEPVGLFHELRTPPLPATHVRAETGLEHLPGATSSTTSPTSGDVPTQTCDLVSHRTESTFRDTDEPGPLTTQILLAQKALSPSARRTISYRSTD